MFALAQKSLCTNWNWVRNNIVGLALAGLTLLPGCAMIEVPVSTAGSNGAVAQQDRGIDPRAIALAHDFNLLKFEAPRGNTVRALIGNPDEKLLLGSIDFSIQGPHIDGVGRTLVGGQPTDVLLRSTLEPDGRIRVHEFRAEGGVHIDQRDVPPGHPVVQIVGGAFETITRGAGQALIDAADHAARHPAPPLATRLQEPVETYSYNPQTGEIAPGAQPAATAAPPPPASPAVSSSPVAPAPTKPAISGSDLKSMGF